MSDTGIRSDDRSRRRWWVGIAGVVAALSVTAVGCTPPPAADAVVDQTSTLAPAASYFFTGIGANSLNGLPGNTVTGQVFTVGITGTMTAVGLSFQQDTASPVGSATLAVSVRAAGLDGLPTGPNLAATTYTGLGSVGRALVTLTLDTPVPVVAGQRLAILVSSSTAMWQVNQAPAAAPHGSYAGGDAFVFNASFPGGLVAPANDLYFRTWVVPA